jgi:hypothetical protein
MMVARHCPDAFEGLGRWNIFQIMPLVFRVALGTTNLWIFKKNLSHILFATKLIRLEISDQSKLDSSWFSFAKKYRTFCRHNSPV